MPAQPGAHSFTDRLLTARDVCEELAISRATLYRLRRRDPTFPDPFYLGPRLVRWRKPDLDRWVDSRRLQRELPHIRPELLGGPRRPGPTRRRDSRSM